MRKEFTVSADTHREMAIELRNARDYLGKVYAKIPYDEKLINALDRLSSSILFVQAQVGNMKLREIVEPKVVPVDLNDEYRGVRALRRGRA